MRYDIVLSPQADHLVAERFETMDVLNEKDGYTHLHGELADQAALFGILKSIYRLGLTLIALYPENYLDDKGEMK